MTFEHWRAIALIAAIGLVGPYAAAARSPAPEWELRLTEQINDVPHAVATSLYPVV